ncbi:biotin transporter BioY [Dongia sp.]|uniref:biotin transporter BioY n=1 Tax=Dongia sp. TaxID=1977262 RepID=UPI003753594E
MQLTLADKLWSGATTNLVKQAALVMAGSLLLAASAHVKVPFWPVPMTMQTFVVLMIGAVYGRNLALATVAAYLVEGAAGLPFFAAGGGLAILAGPTAGYLFGFLVAAGLVGHLADRGLGRNIATAAAIFIAGDIAIFVCGVAWLSTITGIGAAIAGGLVPFLLAEVVKIALACALLPWAWRRA